MLDYSDVKLFDYLVKEIEKSRNADGEGICSKGNYNYPMLSAMLFSMGRCLKNNGRKTDVLDFGGSLGVSWFKNRAFFEGLCGRYCVVEQKCVVELGKEKVPEVEFYYTIEECLSTGISRDVCLFSSVLQYLDNPMEMVDSILKAGFDNIIVDRALFAADEVTPRIAIQYNNDGHGQYPINIMSREDVLSRILNSGYRLVAEWPSFDLMPVKIGVRSINLQSQGFMVSRK
jgi:putative methyltransferase (TIGR04325 family)